MSKYLLAIKQAFAGFSFEEMAAEALKSDEERWHEVDVAQVELHRIEAEKCLKEGDQEGYEEHMESMAWYQGSIEAYHAQQTVHKYMPQEAMDNLFPNDIGMEQIYLTDLNPGDWFVDKGELYEVTEIVQSTCMIILAKNWITNILDERFYVNEKDIAWRVMCLKELQRIDKERQDAEEQHGETEGIVN